MILLLQFFDSLSEKVHVATYQAESFRKLLNELQRSVRKEVHNEVRVIYHANLRYTVALIVRCAFENVTLITL